MRSPQSHRLPEAVFPRASRAEMLIPTMTGKPSRARCGSRLKES